ncbi:hypothetical protein GCM10010451_68560 [Streptomyces virens]|uniref:Uncharacterized protein n=1 Tax=Streptomyces virens TaxID=285572 RepID=A0ABN3V208_9ACTN
MMIERELIKQGDKVAHKNFMVTGVVGRLEDKQAYVHWSTGEKAWYSIDRLEVVKDE